MSTLDDEEREIQDAVEAGRVKRSKNALEIQKRHQEYAQVIGRGSLCRRFPYNICYSVNSGFIDMLAVWHGSRSQVRSSASRLRLGQ